MPNSGKPISRRRALQAAAAVTLAGLARPSGAAARAETQATSRAVTRGRIRQSVSRWCYQKMALPDLCRAVSGLGLTAIDLLEAQDWAVVREHGLICSMGYGGGGTIREGLNNRANHARIIESLIATMPSPCRRPARRLSFTPFNSKCMNFPTDHRLPLTQWTSQPNCYAWPATPARRHTWLIP